MGVNKDIVMRVYERLLEKDNLPKGVAEDLQSMIKYIKEDDADGAYKFALKSLESGPFSPYKGDYGKLVIINPLEGGKRKRRQTRGKRTKKHNKSMRGGKDTHYKTTGSNDGSAWFFLLVIAFAIAMAAQSSMR
jgi:hypothetical protein